MFDTFSACCTKRSGGVAQSEALRREARVATWRSGRHATATVLLLRVWSASARSPRRRRRLGPWLAQPQRCLGGLHRLVDHGEQLCGQRVQVDLLAQAGNERLNGAGRVVAAPVEAPV